MRPDMFHSIFPMVELRVAKSAPPTIRWDTVCNWSRPSINKSGHCGLAMNLLYMLAQVVFAVIRTLTKWFQETLKGIVLLIIMLQTRILSLTEYARIIVQICVKKADPFDLGGMLGFFMALPIRRSAEAGVTPRALVLLQLGPWSSGVLTTLMLPPALAASPGGVRGTTAIGAS